MILIPIQFEEKDIQRIVLELVINVSPERVRGALPGLPAHLLFMCLRYADKMKSAPMLQGLLSKSLSAIKKVVIENAANLDLVSFWLSNCHMLYMDMKLFSGEAKDTVVKDHEDIHLNSFDLSDYRMVLSDLLIQIFHTLVKYIEQLVGPLVLPGLVEHEPIVGISSKPLAHHGRRHGSSSDAGDVTRTEFKAQDVIACLQGALGSLEAQYVDSKLISQIFRQIFYSINVTIVNNLILRKEYCHWSKGLQISYNLTQLDEWGRNHHLENCSECLVDAMQICKLLQAPKTKIEDVDAIYDHCKDLNPLQIQKVLTMYTPDEFEDKVPAALIRAVVEKGGSRADPSKLTLDAGHVFAIRIPFTPSVPQFAALEVPKSLRLDFLQKL